MDVKFPARVSEFQRITHLGNTANNAFYNMTVLGDNQNLTDHQELFEFGLDHALSAPAWEVLDFQIRNPDWISSPTWEDIPDADAINSVRKEWPERIGSGRLVQIMRIIQIIIRKLHLEKFASMMQIRGFAPLLLFLRRAQPKFFMERHNLSIVYGTNSLFTLRIPRRRKATVVFLEHGTFRWARSASTTNLETLAKRLYLREARKADFSLVTNLDPESIRATIDTVGMKWAAVPHPYVFNSATPYRTDPEWREELQSSTESEHLILLGASHNWSPIHDKGTNLALEAFRRLREKGSKVGLILIRWGLQVQESEEFIAKHNINRFVHWTLPLPRLTLQRMAANCDVSWNQFAYEGIGAFDLRMLEQGVPHVSRGPDDFGSSLIGARVPWESASSITEIEEAAELHLKQYEGESREDVLSNHANRYREWLATFHSPEVLRGIQSIVYARLREGNPELSDMQNLWSTVSADLAKTNV